MIITERLKVGRRTEPSFVISCNGCARVCGVGGEDGAKRLVRETGADGYMVIPKCCVEKVVETFNIPKEKTLLLLCCDVGTYFFERWGYKVIEAAKTIGIGGLDNDGKVVLVRPFAGISLNKKKWIPIGKKGWIRA